VDSVSVRARCTGCGRGLPFEEWQRGATECRTCAAAPVVTRRASQQAEPPTPLATDYRAYNQMVDEIPDELIDELLAALEAEADTRRSAESAAAGPREDTLLVGVLDEMGFGRSPTELPWTLWGFAIGFALNVCLAKYAQMASGGPMGQFLAPMMVGGLLAGITCAAIGWGIARLRER
jgi:hypothetical protein